MWCPTSQNTINLCALSPARKSISQTATELITLCVNCIVILWKQRRKKWNARPPFLDFRSIKIKISKKKTQKLKQWIVLMVNKCQRLFSSENLFKVPRKMPARTFHDLEPVYYQISICDGHCSLKDPMLPKYRQRGKKRRDTKERKKISTRAPY